MKNKKFLTESDRKAIISDKEKAILESFAKTFNKIKRIDENRINENIDEIRKNVQITFNELKEIIEKNPHKMTEDDVRKLFLCLKAMGKSEEEVKNMIKKGEHEFENDPDDDVFNFKDAKMHIIRELILNIRPWIFNSPIPKLAPVFAEYERLKNNSGNTNQLNQASIDENEIPKKFKPMDIVIWKPKKTRWNNDYSVRYGAKAKVIEVLGDMLKIEWLKDPSNLELVGRQMDGNYFTDDFELAGTNNNDHEDWGLEARKQQNRFNPEINPYELEENEISENEGNLDDKDLIDNINNLDDSDLGWSKDPNKGLSIYFDWDDVDEDLLLTQLLNLIKKVNPNADLGGKKQSLMGRNILANFNAKLYSASQRSFSAIRGLKDYFEDNLQIFK